MRMIFYSKKKTGTLEKNPEFSQRSRTYDLEDTTPDALDEFPVA